MLYANDIGIYEDTPKTEQSRRIISIPNELVTLLKAYKKEYSRYRLAMGSKWVGTEDFILTQENGKPMHPDTLTEYCSDFERKYNKLIDKENESKKECDKKKLLPHLNPHAFRHTQASLLIACGTDCITISKRLGHSKVSTTTDIYSHLMQKADKTASDVLEKLLIKVNDK